MKKRFFYGALGLLTLGAFAACSSEEEVKNDQKLMMKYQLSVNVSDLDTRSGEPTPPDWVLDEEDPANLDDCPEISEVDDMVNGGYLYANVLVDYGLNTHPQGLDYETLTVKLEKFGDKLMMEPMILPLGTHQIKSIEIMHNNGTPDDTTDDKMVFAGVAYNSKYKNFVPTEHLLPMTFTLDEETYKFQKVEDPTTVLCAVNAISEDFGFEMWNTNFVKVYCIPFLVNYCDPQTGHSVIPTKVEVYQADKNGEPMQEPIFINSNCSNAEHHSRNGYCDNTCKPTTMNTFCISDNKAIADEDEYYFIKIYDARTMELIDTYEGTVEDLKDPKTHEGWDETYEFIHYQISDCNPCGGENAATWAGETFKDKDIDELTEEGWEGLMKGYGHVKIDEIKNGDLEIKRERYDRYIYTPVFSIAQAAKFCITYGNNESGSNCYFSFEPATAGTYRGADDLLLLAPNRPDHNKPTECEKWCEPGCLRVKITIEKIQKGNPKDVVIEEVKLTRMEDCDEDHNNNN